jgi:hypothetical protein
MNRRRIRAAMVGDSEPGLERLLADVMAETDLDLVLEGAADSTEIVFAVVTRGDVVSVIQEVRKHAPNAPIIALISIRDDRLARRTIDCGAQACWSLDTGLDLLRFQLVTQLGAQRRASPVSTFDSADLFVLGPRARAVVADLRGSALPHAYPRRAVGRDAEERLEAALRADFGHSPPSPFRIGIYARLELTLMRLDAAAIDQVEQAIQADLEISESRSIHRPTG